MPQKIFLQAVEGTGEREKGFLETARTPWKSRRFGSIPVFRYNIWSSRVYKVTPSCSNSIPLSPNVRLQHPVAANYVFVRFPQLSCELLKS